MTPRVYGKFILGLALGLRAAVVALVLFAYPRGWLFSKAPDLGYLAQSLCSGLGLSSPFGGTTGPTAFLAPGYPAALALTFRIFGSYSAGAAAAMLGLQTVFSVLTVAVILHLAQGLSGPVAADLAGVFWATSMPLLWLPALLWDTSLSILLLTGMVALALRPVKPIGYWVAMGAYCGLAMLVNPSLALALVAIFGWTMYQAREMGGRGPGLCVLVWLAIFAPWPVRNARVLHAFLPLRSNFAYEVWQGNHAGGTGAFDASLEPLANKQEYRDYAAKGEVRYMRDKGQLAAVYIRTHPQEFFRLCGQRVFRFWTGSGARENSAVMEAHAVVTSVLGLAGLVGVVKRRRAVGLLFLLPLFLFPLPYYITHPDFRFRLVLDPLLTVLSADGMIRMRLAWQAMRGA